MDQWTMKRINELCDGAMNSEQCNGSNNSAQYNGSNNSAQCNGSNRAQCNGSNNSAQCNGSNNSAQCNGSNNSAQCNGSNNSAQCNCSNNSAQCNGLKNISPLHNPQATRTGSTLQHRLSHLLKFGCSCKEITPNLAMKNKHFVCKNFQTKTIQFHPIGRKWYICWRIRDQLDVNSYYVLFHFFYAQHVSDINISIIRSLRLFYCITTLVVCSVKMDQCCDTIEKSQAPDDWCINVQNMLSIEEVK